MPVAWTLFPPALSHWQYASHFEFSRYLCDSFEHFFFPNVCGFYFLFCELSHVSKLNCLNTYKDWFLLLFFYLTKTSCAIAKLATVKHQIGNSTRKCNRNWKKNIFLYFHSYTHITTAAGQESMTSTEKYRQVGACTSVHCMRLSPVSGKDRTISVTMTGEMRTVVITPIAWLNWLTHRTVQTQWHHQCPICEIVTWWETTLWCRIPAESRLTLIKKQTSQQMQERPIQKSTQPCVPTMLCDKRTATHLATMTALHHHRQTVKSLQQTQKKSPSRSRPKWTAQRVYTCKWSKGNPNREILPQLRIHRPLMTWCLLTLMYTTTTWRATWAWHGNPQPRSDVSRGPGVARAK